MTKTTNNIKQAIIISKFPTQANIFVEIFFSLGQLDYMVTLSVFIVNLSSTVIDFILRTYLFGFFQKGRVKP